MFNDETQEVETSENIDDETTDVEEETTEESQNWEAEAKKWRAIAERKAKKAEQATKEPATRKPELTGSLSEDDILTITMLQDKELIERARKIARLEGISLAEAVENPMFTYAKQAYEEEKRKEKSQMEASRGSGTRGQRKTFTTPGLTKEQHKELFMKRQGR